MLAELASEYTVAPVARTHAPVSGIVSRVRDDVRRPELGKRIKYELPTFKVRGDKPLLQKLEIIVRAPPFSST